MSGIIGRLREQFQSSLFVGTRHTLVSSSGTTLCATCAALDFRKILRKGLPDESKVSLGTLLDITQNSDRCAFCRLVADLIRRRWRLDDFPDADVQGIKCFVSARTCGTLDPNLDERQTAHRLYIHTSTRPLDISSALIAAKVDLSLDIQLLEEDSCKVARSKDLHGRRVKDEVDIHLIERWIRLCEDAHGEACRIAWWASGNEGLPEFARMVDVIQMALVHAGRGCRYVALSYVWGGSGRDHCTTMANTKARSLPFGIEESALPLTIVDAIQLTRQLGERYLWVDTLCIIQDSQEDKAVQISLMDRIYGQSALTIIAASGTSVRDGLPGLRTGSRIPNQHIECVQGLHLSIPLPASDAVIDSTWDTRGWTFQEEILSRRRLYFTQNQIYFSCSRDIWGEDLVAESKTLRFSFHPMSLKSRDLLPRITDQAASYHRSYQNAVDRYTQRHLTVESDIIDALRALMNVITRGLEPAGSNPKGAFRFGMWIRILDLCLLWQPRLNAVHSRRITTNPEHSRWPSWAWSGWKGAVRYPDGSHMLNGIETDVQPLPTGSLVTAWNMVDENGTIIQLDVKQVPSYQRVYENPDKYPPETYVPSKSYPNDLVLDFLPPRGTLIFRTQCAPFQVLKLDDGALAEPAKATAHTIFHVIPVDQVAPHYAGRIVLPISTPSPTILELVVLSRNFGFIGLWDESVWGEKSDGLHVMAVERMRDDSRVNERVGIGFVAESAWMKSGAEERVVLLA